MIFHSLALTQGPSGTLPLEKATSHKSRSNTHNLAYVLNDVISLGQILII